MWSEIKPELFDQSPFRMLGQEWMLITAENEGVCNTMTAAWGGFGVMWGKNVVFAVIRPQRYTREFVDAADRFSLCFLPAAYKKQLGYLGSVSGRDENKIGISGLTVAHEGKTPFFEEADTVMLCKKLYAQACVQECFIEQPLAEEWYPEHDYHIMYIAEVEKILLKK